MSVKRKETGNDDEGRIKDTRQESRINGSFFNLPICRWKNAPTDAKKSVETFLWWTSKSLDY
jgi:hypothetical protein